MYYASLEGLDDQYLKLYDRMLREVDKMPPPFPERFTESLDRVLDKIMMGSEYALIGGTLDRSWGGNMSEEKEEEEIKILIAKEIVEDICRVAKDKDKCRAILHRILTTGENAKELLNLSEEDRIAIKERMRDFGLGEPHSKSQLSDIFRSIGSLIHYIDVEEKLFAITETPKLKIAVREAGLDTKAVMREIDDLEKYIEKEDWHMAKTTLSTLSTLLGKAIEERKICGG
jgi:hypothetical protein